MHCYHKLNFSEGEDRSLCQRYTIYVTLYNINGLNGFSLHEWDNVVANTRKVEKFT